MAAARRKIMGKPSPWKLEGSGTQRDLKYKTFSVKRVL